jgi:glucosylceramidase
MRNILFIAFIFVSCASGSAKVVAANPVVEKKDTVFAFTTSADQNNLLTKSYLSLATSTIASGANNIALEPSIMYQTIDGFGYALTGGSAQLINQLSAAKKNELLQNLFNPQNADGIAVSYLRISIGASDLDSGVFSYNDLPVGQEDLSLAKFSLGHDTLNLIPVLKQIIAIQPAIKIMASPWSPPTWMKSNKNSMGGILLAQYYNVYAQYLAKYITLMKSYGITIDAITLQNEPENDKNNPSLLMNATEQANFIKNNVGPVFQQQNIKTKIVLFDHNCDHPEYPISILNDAQAASYVDGSAFHLYLGAVSALSTVKAAHPSKNLYFTEQWTGSQGSFSGDFIWHVKNVIIGTMNNWSKTAIEWNLANDPSYQPHTVGGCTQCKGALTINGDTYSKNVSYYIIAQASKFIPAGSIRINSSDIANVDNVAFVTPQGKKVLLVLNSSNTAQTFTVSCAGKTFSTTLAGQAATTYTW